jgi:hypothetical protein
VQSVLIEELDTQKQQEDELQHLVEVMAPARVRPETVFTELLKVLDIAAKFTTQLIL